MHLVLRSAIEVNVLLLCYTFGFAGAFGTKWSTFTIVKKSFDSTYQIINDCLNPWHHSLHKHSQSKWIRHITIPILVIVNKITPEMNIIKRCRGVLQVSIDNDGQKPSIQKGADEHRSHHQRTSL